MKFLKINIDEVSNLCGEAALCVCNEYVIYVPTFSIYQNGKKVDELIGASRCQLENLLKKYA